MDWIGISLSGLCLAHCILLPAFLAILPLLTLAPLPAWLHDTEWFHAALLIPVVLVSGPVLVSGARNDIKVGALGLVAFIALFAALQVEQVWGERGLTVVGATLLSVAHWRNLRNRHSER